MKSFVTGACGFLGSHLVTRLMDDGDRVMIYDRKGPALNPFPDAQYYQGDTLCLNGLSQAMHAFKPEIVYHLAALADVRNALKQPTEQMQQNFLATANVLEAMRAAECRQIVFTSSAVVYGDLQTHYGTTWTGTLGFDMKQTFLTGPAIAEHGSGYGFPQQTSIYGAMKLASESLISAYCVGYGMRADIFRLVSLTGAGYRHGNLMDFYRKLKANPGRLELFGSPTQQKYYCDVSDFVDAVRLVVEKTPAMSSCQMWNVSHGEPNTIRDSVDAVADCLGLAPEIVTSGNAWAGDLPSLVLDCGKLRALGWSPKVPITTSMRRTVRDLISRGIE